MHDDRFHTSFANGLENPVADPSLDLVMLVADRSAEGLDAVALWGECFPDFADRLLMWNATSFEFIAHLRRTDGRPVLTVMALDLSEALSELVPELMRRAESCPGLCGTWVCVGAERRTVVEASMKFYIADAGLDPLAPDEETGLPPEKVRLH